VALVLVQMGTLDRANKVCGFSLFVRVRAAELGGLTSQITTPLSESRRGEFGRCAMADRIAKGSPGMPGPSVDHKQAKAAQLIDSYLKSEQRQLVLLRT